MSRLSVHPQELRLQNQHGQSTDPSYICTHIIAWFFPTARQHSTEKAVHAEHKTLNPPRNSAETKASVWTQPQAAGP